MKHVNPICETGYIFFLKVNTSLDIARYAVNFSTELFLMTK